MPAANIAKLNPQRIKATIQYIIVYSMLKYNIIDHVQCRYRAWTQGYVMYIVHN